MSHSRHVLSMCHEMHRLLYALYSRRDKFHPCCLPLAMDSDEEIPYVYALPSRSQYFGLVAIAYVLSFLSIAGSAGIILISRRKLGQLLQRQLLALSLADIITSTSFIVQPFMLPRWTGYPFGWGNSITCTIAGCMTQMGMTLVAGCNCAISVTFFLRIRLGWKERRISNWFEIPADVIIVSAALAMTLAGVFFECYNPNQTLHICIVTEIPFACLARDEVECLRGAQSPNIHIAQVIWMLLLTVSSVICVLSVNLFVRRRTLASSRQSLGARSVMQRRVRLTARQAVLYSFVYLNMTFWLVVTLAIALKRADKDRDSFLFTVLLWVFFPSQGIFNFLVYTYPTVQQRQEAMSLAASAGRRSTPSLWRAYIDTLWEGMRSSSSPHARPAGTNPLQRRRRESTTDQDATPERSHDHRVDKDDSEQLEVASQHHQVTTTAATATTDPFFNELGDVISEFFSAEIKATASDDAQP